jgi:hypothetical protein
MVRGSGFRPFVFSQSRQLPSDSDGSMRFVPLRFQPRDKPPLQDSFRKCRSPRNGFRLSTRSVERRYLTVTGLRQTMRPMTVRSSPLGKPISRAQSSRQSLSCLAERPRADSRNFLAASCQRVRRDRCGPHSNTPDHSETVAAGKLPVLPKTRICQAKERRIETRNHCSRDQGSDRSTSNSEYH